MKSLLRWASFTLSITLIGLCGAFAMHYLSRLYTGFQAPAVMLSALVVFCAASALAAISFASKLDEAKADGAARSAARIDPKIDG